MTKYLPLVTVIVIAAALRFWNIAGHPVGFNADEAALGYNAYSLGLTGRDEHGHPIPVNLESFGDFKPALYSYLLVPLVQLGGLNEWIVRFPSAFFGVLAVFVIYLLVIELTPFPSLYQREGKQRGELGLLAALLLAISPWHLHFSRGAWETNLATTFILVAVYYFVRWLKRHQFRDLGFGTWVLILSVYTYQSARIIAPVLFLVLAVSYRRHVLKHIRHSASAAVIGMVLMAPLIWVVLGSDAASRFSGVGFLADSGPLERANQLRGQHSDWNTFISRLLHNRPVLYSQAFVKNYTDHFFGNFLFINGDVIQRNRSPETGQFYLTDFIFLALGLVVLTRSISPYTKIIWIWLLVAPLASALTFQTPHAIRAHNMVVPLSMVITLGYFELLKRWRFIGICGLVIVNLWQLTRYLHEYYVHYPQTYPAAWEYGFKEVVDYLTQNQDRYDQILITDKYDQPYILFLFYLKYPPQAFQNHHELSIRDKFNFSTVRDFDKYHFTNTNWDKVSDIHYSLIIAAPEDIPVIGVNIVKTIYFPGGTPAFKIISN